MLPITLSWALCLGCAGEGEGRPDEELGGLVISPETSTPSVDQDEASSNAPDLVNAVRMPHAWIGEQIGAHVVRGRTSLKVEESSAVIEELDDELLLDFDGEDRFLATLDNSMEYGRHAIYDGSTLYLRPRFGLYHGRAPQSEAEAAEIRNEMYGVAGDYLELLSRQLEVSDKGVSTREGRAAREVLLKLAPKPRPITPETLTHRQWRDTIEVKALSGSVFLDAETGVPLYVQLAGSIAFERDKRRFVMSLGAELTISEIGHTRAIAAPAEDMVLAIAPRRRELAERDSLLESIAPPARTAPVPSDPGGGK